ncbi:hypothetical protein [Halohasta salina]|uniref:hypothetical protein n=1 Tax=Halohasta salina TaxID=2961621 RepID=UPI0020A40281|nr:hypothetical protein [Halohasta salina]
MTRFDADTPTERRQLFAEAIDAHRERGSEFITIEPDELPPGSDEELLPWVQFSDTTISMDCTDAELDRLKGLLDEYPEFRAESLESPEEAEGTHARITARSDPDRLATFVDEAFQTVYGYAVDYTAWIVAI